MKIKNTKCLQDLNREIMKFSDHDQMSTHPKVHYGLNAVYLQMREEISNMKPDLLKRRKEKLKQLLIEDWLETNADLRKVDLAFIETQL